MLDIKSSCLNCKTSWKDKTLQAVEILGEYDGISYYVCPECGQWYDRFTSKMVRPRFKLVAKGDKDDV